MAGYEEYSYTYEKLTAGSNEMDLANFPYLDLANENSLTVGGNSYQNAYRSFFGRIMYNYDNRYYVQLNARGDASSILKYVLPSAASEMSVSATILTRHTLPSIRHFCMTAQVLHRFLL